MPLTLETLGQYQLSYRHLHGTPPPAAEINRVILKALDEYRAKGTASGIDPILLMTHLDDALNRRRDPAFFGTPLRWYARTLQHWVALYQTGALATLPSPQRNAILRHLRRTDLTPFGLHQI